MIKVLVAIAGSTALVCARAASGEVAYLGGTGQQGAPTKEKIAWLWPLRWVIDRAYDGVPAAQDPEPKLLNNIDVNPHKGRAGADSIRSTVEQVTSSVRQLGRKTSPHPQAQQPGQDQQSPGATGMSETAEHD